ncbi:MAG: oxidoreductase [Oscillospiraceae bacterium]
MIAFITGASSGIGFQTAKLLLQRGDTVYCGARRIEAMEELKALGAHILKLDVTIEDEISASVDFILQKSGRIDVLINNAGYGMFGSIEDVKAEDAKRQFEVNVFGLANVTKAVIPIMRKNKFGRIINISSMGGKMYTPLGGWYHSSKFAVEGLSDCMRYELRHFGIAVVLIEPGAIDSEWYDIMLKNMNSTKENSEYKTTIEAYEKYVLNNRKFFSPPIKVSKTILKAIKSRHPRARYSVGFMAKPAICLYKLLPTKIYDRALHLIFK